MNQQDMARNMSQPLTVPLALAEAFRAGAAYAVGSHKDFKQTHEPLENVVNYLEYRLYGGSEPVCGVCGISGQYEGGMCDDCVNDAMPGGPET